MEIDLQALITEAVETLEQGNTEKALFSYQEAARTDPRSATAYDGIAQCQYKLRRFDEALQAAKIASGLDPNLVSPHLIQAYLFAQHKEWEQSHREALSALHLAPDQFETLDCYGTVLAGEGDPERAIPYLRRAAELEPSALSTHHNLAVIYGQLGDTANLIRELQAINRLNPSFSNRIWLASAIHHRYLVYLIAAMLGIMLVAVVLRMPLLLLIPALYLGWLGLNAYWELKNKRWQRGLMLLVVIVVYAGALGWLAAGG